MAFIKKGFNSIKQSVSGGSKADDKEFKQLHDQLHEAKKGLDGIGGHVSGYLGNESVLLQSQRKLAEDMTGAVNKDNSDEATLVRENLALVDKMIAEKAKIDDKMRREFLDPINKYRGQYREIDERMRERRRRADEVDKLQDQVKKYKEKGDARLNATERKLESTQKAYEELHAELMADIPRLVADKELFFHPLVAILLDEQYEFYSTMAARLAELRDRRIDRGAVHTHPPVITPRNQSSVSKSYSSFGGGAASDYNSAQPASGGYGGQDYGAPAPHSGGYGAPPQQGGYGAPPQQGGYGAPSHQGGGYGAPPQQGYAAPPSVPGRGPALPPPSHGVRARAQWDFASEDPQELPFRSGDILTIIQQSGDWWTAELHGRTGLIPANYVQLI